MRNIRRAIERALLYLAVLSAIIAIGTVSVWLTLQYVGIRISLAGVLMVVVAAVIYFILNAPRPTTPPPTPPPARPRRQITWEDAQRAASLYRAGLITKEQFDTTLGAVVPPGPGPVAQEDGRYGRR